MDTRKILETGVMLGDLSRRGLLGSAAERIQRAAREAVEVGCGGTPTQVLAYVRGHVPEATQDQVDAALAYLCARRRLAHCGPGYVLK